MILILFSTVPSCAGNEKKKKATFSGWLRQVYLPEQDIQESLAEQKTQKECSPKCPKALYDLVERYFEPYKDGIYEDMISNARFPDDNVIKSRGLILIQVLNNTIYVDKSMMTYFEHYDQARLDFLLDRVHDYITRQSTKHLDIQSKDLDDQWNIKYSNFTDQSKDFEFDPKDCQNYWTGSTYGIRMGDVSGANAVLKYAKLPIFTITKCNGRDSIPIPQWYERRDGPFEEWDEKRHNFRNQVEQSPHYLRNNKAVFRGAFRTYSSFTTSGMERPTLVDEQTWPHLGRGKLQFLGWQRPDLFDIAVKVEKPHRYLFESYVHRLPFTCWMSTLEQAINYKYVIYSEGWCGWADRLKILLLFNSTILLQETPCREYYQDLMQPYVDYVPLDGTFTNLTTQTQWARSNPQMAATIANNSVQLGEEYLSQRSIKCYMDLVLAKYSSLVKYRPKKRPFAEKWIPKCPVREAQ